MKKIGMIVAVLQEIDTLFQHLGAPLDTDTPAGYEVHRYLVSGNEIYVVPSGAGELAAAASTQLLISTYHVDLIVNFGVCGGLTPDMSLTQSVVVRDVIHYDFDATAFLGGCVGQYPGYPTAFIPASSDLVALALSTEPALKPVVCASADKFVEDPTMKQQLHKTFGAEICEMEAAGILLTANRCHVPALLMKAVSDSVNGDAGQFEQMVHEAAATCLKVLLRILDTL